VPRFARREVTRAGGCKQHFDRALLAVAGSRHLHGRLKAGHANAKSGRFLQLSVAARSKSQKERSFLRLLSPQK